MENKLDGNAAAGVLQEIFPFDMTLVQATCTAWHGMLAAPTTLDALSEGLNKRYNERGIDFF